MKITFELEYWKAVRLKSLVKLGYKTLRKEGRTQLGIDGITWGELNELSEILDKLSDSPKFDGVKIDD